MEEPAATREELEWRTKEELTWRAGIEAWIKAQLAHFTEKCDSLRQAIDTSAAASDGKAQAANDALQKLLEANLAARIQLADAREYACRRNLDKIEAQIAIAHTSAAAAVGSVDVRLMDRLKSLKDLIDLRSEMSGVAINKAEEATERRFEAVNGFRQVLSDQTAQYVTRTVLDARLEQIASQISAAADVSHALAERGNASRAELATRLASLESKLYVGGAGIVVIITVLQLVLNTFHTH